MSWIPAFVKQLLKTHLHKRGWTQSGDVRDSAQPFSMRGGLELLKSIGIQPGTIIDLGAAEGKWTLCAKEVFSESRFLLCEPLPERKDELIELAANSRGQLRFSQVIVGNSTTPLLFDVSSDLDGSGVYGGTSGTVVELPQETLDNLLSKADFEQPYLIKFDTHGFESQILAGASRTLNSTQAIVMECYLHHVSPTAKLFWEMCGQLNELGFRPVHIGDLLARPYDATLWQMDLFFVKSDHPVFSHAKYR